MNSEKKERSVHRKERFEKFKIQNKVCY
jgi:hypothetical protein